MKEKLTQREEEVLDLISHGYSNTKMADKLYVSRRTIENHRQRIIKKLNLSGSKLVVYAVENRLKQTL